MSTRADGLGRCMDAEAVPASAASRFRSVQDLGLGGTSCSSLLSSVFSQLLSGVADQTCCCYSFGAKGSSVDRRSSLSRRVNSINFRKKWYIEFIK
jgi:hypothetical protein